MSEVRTFKRWPAKEKSQGRKKYDKFIVLYDFFFRSKCHETKWIFFNFIFSEQLGETNFSFVLIVWMVFAWFLDFFFTNRNNCRHTITEKKKTIFNRNIAEINNNNIFYHNYPTLYRDYNVLFCFLVYFYFTKCSGDDCRSANFHSLNDDRLALVSEMSTFHRYKFVVRNFFLFVAVFQLPSDKFVNFYQFWVWSSS